MTNEEENVCKLIKERDDLREQVETLQRRVESLASSGQLQALWKLVDEANAGTMSITIDAYGVERSKAMIFVSGVEEVAEITSAIQKIEDSWNEPPPHEARG